MFRRPGRIAALDRCSRQVALAGKATGPGRTRPAPACMGLFAKLFGRKPARTRHGVDELALRLGISADDLQRTPIEYHEFFIRKRSGGQRRILAPAPALKSLQRQINRRLLARLKAHPLATGFERGHSVATNAAFHAGRSVVVRLDLVDFFATTRAERVLRYFRAIGWDKAAAGLLTRICTHDAGLPQGAPTSPRLSNLVNYGLDLDFEGLAIRAGARYSRYADDITFSFGFEDWVDEDSHTGPVVRRGDAQVSSALGRAPMIAEKHGYRIHTKRKRKHRVMRTHHRQIVTGVVVNERPNLPRNTRRWLRAVEHRLATGGSVGRRPSLTESQLAGWRAYEAMILAAQPVED